MTLIVFSIRESLILDSRVGASFSLLKRRIAEIRRNRLKAQLGIQGASRLQNDDDDEPIPSTRRGGRSSQFGDWEKVGWLASKRMRTVIGLESMNGMMAVEHKKRVVKKRVRQAPLGEEVAPIEMRQEDMQAAKNETMENVASVSRGNQLYFICRTNQTS